MDNKNGFSYKPFSSEKIFYTKKSVVYIVNSSSGPVVSSVLGGSGLDSNFWSLTVSVFVVGDFFFLRIKVSTINSTTITIAAITTK